MTIAKGLGQLSLICGAMALLRWLAWSVMMTMTATLLAGRRQLRRQKSLVPVNYRSIAVNYWSIQEKKPYRTQKNRHKCRNLPPKNRQKNFSHLITCCTFKASGTAVTRPTKID